MNKEFIPATRIGMLTPLFDTLCSLVGLGKRYRNTVIASLPIKNNGKLRILDAGCGTGSLALDIKNKYAEIEIHGIDPDPKILSIAKEKFLESGHKIILRRSFMQDLPYPDGYFDVVYSSLVIHHIPSKQKIPAMKEIRRVLKKSGTFYLCDFGKVRSYLLAPLYLFVLLLEEGKDNYEGKIPGMLKEAGFEKVRSVGHYRYNIEFLYAQR